MRWGLGAVACCATLLGADKVGWDEKWGSESLKSLCPQQLARDIPFTRAFQPHHPSLLSSSFALFEYKLAGAFERVSPCSAHFIPD